MGGGTEPPALHDLESRRDRSHPRLEPGGRRARHYCQRRDARLHAERDAAGDLVEQLCFNAFRRTGDRARAISGRSRRRGDVSVIIGQRLHDGPDAQRRRWQIHALNKSMH